jgi:hypothetical protein
MEETKMTNKYCDDCENCRMFNQCFKATFIGYQGDGEGNYFPLFNDEIGSTVTAESLKEKGLAVPIYPSLKEWLKERK